jgi:hypothetical protein
LLNTDSKKFQQRAGKLLPLRTRSEPYLRRKTSLPLILYGANPCQLSSVHTLKVSRDIPSPKGLLIGAIRVAEEPPSNYPKALSDMSGTEA